MGTASYPKKVRVATTLTNPNWLDVPATSPSLNSGADALDDTEVGGDGFRSRVLGLQDWSVQCDSNYADGNAALTAIRNAWLNRSDLYVQYLPFGDSAPNIPKGFQGKVVVESFNLSGDVGGLETVGITLQADGALAAAA